MAEAALLGVAKSVLGQLGSPALKEALLLWNMKKDLKRLEDTTNNIVNILYDAERKESKEERVKGWLSRLRAVFYDIDDFFDAVAWRALRKKTMNGNAFRKEWFRATTSKPIGCTTSLRRQILRGGCCGKVEEDDMVGHR